MFQMSMDSPRFPTTSQGSGRRVQLQKGERYLVLFFTSENRKGFICNSADREHGRK